MKLPSEGYLLRIFVGETDRYKGKPLYEEIVLKARELNLAGATVTRESWVSELTAEFTQRRYYVSRKIYL